MRLQKITVLHKLQSVFDPPCVVCSFSFVFQIPSGNNVSRTFEKNLFKPLLVPRLLRTVKEKSLQRCRATPSANWFFSCLYSIEKENEKSQFVWCDLLLIRRNILFLICWNFICICWQISIVHCILHVLMGQPFFFLRSQEFNDKDT